MSVFVIKIVGEGHTDGIPELTTFPGKFLNPPGKVVASVCQAVRSIRNVFLTQTGQPVTPPQTCLISDVTCTSIHRVLRIFSLYRFIFRSFTRLHNYVEKRKPCSLYIDFLCLFCVLTVLFMYQTKFSLILVNMFTKSQYCTLP